MPAERAAVILTCLLLAGCLDGPIVMASAQRSAATWSSMVYAAQDGPILVEVQGSALGVPGAALAPLAARAMTGAVIGHPTRFTADPAQAPRRNFRTVVVLDPALTMDEEDACAGRIASRPPSPGGMAALAVFCNNQDPLSSARGSTAAARPDDPAVAGLLAALARETFRQPQRDFQMRVPWDF